MSRGQAQQCPVLGSRHHEADVPQRGKGHGGQTCNRILEIVCARERLVGSEQGFLVPLGVLELLDEPRSLSSSSTRSMNSPNLAHMSAMAATKGASGLSLGPGKEFNDANETVSGPHREGKGGLHARPQRRRAEPDPPPV